MKLILGPIIGEVLHNRAKIWIFWHKDSDNETAPQCLIFKDEVCTQEISESEFLTVSSSVHETKFENKPILGVAGLANISFPTGEKKLYFKIKPSSESDTQESHVYSFHPSPQIGAKIEELSFALISCHKHTFENKEKDKKLVASMWSSLKNEMRNNDCRFLIQAGDQIYADHERYNVWENSLNEDSLEKRLKFYRNAYLKSWNFPEVQNLMQTFSQYMIWDDHDITNGWGSNKEHSKEVRYRRVFETARQVYNEFQHCHNPDPLRNGKIYFSFNYGPVAFLFMDLRGQRDITLYDPSRPADSFPLAGKEQWDDITSLLNSEVLQKSKILFVVTSVPVCHLSRKFGSLGIFMNDIRDQWSTQHNKMERRKLLKLLYQWSGEKKRPVIILGGDVHVGTIANITEQDEPKRTIHQITSSPITNKPSRFLDYFLTSFSSRFNFHLDTERIIEVKGEITKRYRKRNFAIIKLQFTEETPSVYLHMYQQGKEEPDITQLI